MLFRITKPDESRDRPNEVVLLHSRDSFYIPIMIINYGNLYPHDPFQGPRNYDRCSGETIIRTKDKKLPILQF